MKNIKRNLIGCILAFVMVAVPLQAMASPVPAAPVISQLGPLSSVAMNLTFRIPDSGGDPITSYDIWTSDDHGQTYSGHFTGTPSGSSTTLRFGISVSAASARFVKVRARTANEVGNWSEPVEMFTTGARPMRVYIQAPDGTPVIGGSVTWVIPETPSGGSAKSSVTYGLTTDGYIDLPQAPAGETTFTLKNGALPNGVLVSGTIRAVLGYPSTILQIVRPPSAIHVVSVEMPNGLPIANAHVEVNSTDMTDAQTRQGFTFTLPDSGLLSATPDYGPIASPSPIASDSPTPTPTVTVTETATPAPTVTVTETATPDSGSEDSYDWGSDVVDIANYDDYYWDYSEYDYYWSDWSDYFKSHPRHTLRSHQLQAGNTAKASNVVVEGDVVASGSTNAMGRFVVKGFTNTVPTATVTYDDGIISQSQTVQLQTPLTHVELSYSPFVSAGAPVYDSTLSTPAIIPVAVAEISDPVSPLRYVTSTNRSKASVIPQKVKFKVIPPAGKKTAKCKSTAASFTTGSNGKAKINICASVSGNYILKSLTPGVQSLGAVLIRVKGAPSMPVRRLVGFSKKPGSLSLSWKTPVYAGGARITGYKVVVKKGSRTVVIKTVTKLATSLTGLSHATRYQVSVSVVTKNGTSNSAQILVPVV